jgi:hypothetical protein
MKSDLALLGDEGVSESEKQKAKKRVEKFLDQLERSVARYGMINLRSDGTNVLMAQKLEKPRSKGSKWDLHRFEPDASGALHYLSKH